MNTRSIVDELAKCWY